MRKIWSDDAWDDYLYWQTNTIPLKPKKAMRYTYIKL